MCHSLDKRCEGLPEGFFWTWLLVGMLGLAVAVIFGTMALLALGSAGPRGIPARRIGLGLMATLCVVAALFFIGQSYAFIPAIIILLAVAAFAFSKLGRGRHG